MRATTQVVIYPQGFRETRCLYLQEPCLQSSPLHVTGELEYWHTGHLKVPTSIYPHFEVSIWPSKQYLRNTQKFERYSSQLSFISLYEIMKHLNKYEMTKQRSKEINTSFQHIHLYCILSNCAGSQSLRSDPHHVSTLPKSRINKWNTYKRLCIVESKKSNLVCCMSSPLIKLFVLIFSSPD